MPDKTFPYFDIVCKVIREKMGEEDMLRWVRCENWGSSWYFLLGLKLKKCKSNLEAETLMNQAIDLAIMDSTDSLDRVNEFFSDVSDEALREMRIATAKMMIRIKIIHARKYLQKFFASVIDRFRTV